MLIFVAVVVSLAMEPQIKNVEEIQSSNSASPWAVLSPKGHLHRKCQTLQKDYSLDYNEFNGQRKIHTSR